MIAWVTSTSDWIPQGWIWCVFVTKTSSIKQEITLWLLEHTIDLKLNDYGVSAIQWTRTSWRYLSRSIRMSKTINRRHTVATIFYTFIFIKTHNHRTSENCAHRLHIGVNQLFNLTRQYCVHLIAAVIIYRWYCCCRVVVVARASLCVVKFSVDHSANERELCILATSTDDIFEHWHSI